MPSAGSGGTLAEGIHRQDSCRTEPGGDTFVVEVPLAFVSIVDSLLAVQEDCLGFRTVSGCWTVAAEHS
jgi:hypothetical protein